MSRARLVCPALRARRGSFSAALDAGVGGFVLFGGTAQSVSALTRELKERAGRPLLLASDLERGPGQQVRGYLYFPRYDAADGFVVKAPVGSNMVPLDFAQVRVRR